MRSSRESQVRRWAVSSSVLSYRVNSRMSSEKASQWRQYRTTVPGVLNMGMLMPIIHVSMNSSSKLVKLDYYCRGGDSVLPLRSIFAFVAFTSALVSDDSDEDDDRGGGNDTVTIIITIIIITIIIYLPPARTCSAFSNCLKGINVAENRHQNSKNRLAKRQLYIVRTSTMAVFGR